MRLNQLPKITFWRAILALVLIAGAYSTSVRFFHGLGPSTNLSDRYPWGIWIGFDVLCGMGTAAGGFTLEDRVHHKTEELERAYRSLTQSEKMASLGKLAAVVAHEINNPLAGILTYSKLVARMAEKGLGEESRLSDARKCLQIIEGESRRCGGIVRNLLTFARQTPIDPQKNDLNAIVERCPLLLGHQMTLQGIELQKQLAANLPAIFCDAGQVQQALLVIMMNALEAMPHGGRLAIESAFDPAERVGKVAVRDDGPGIPPQILSHIIEPFFTTKEEGKGTGRGLPIALGIVRQHGGNIEVESIPDRGTTFTVLLPEEPSKSLETAT